MYTQSGQDILHEGLDFQEKHLVPAGLKVMIFSHLQKHEKLVASEKN